MTQRKGIAERLRANPHERFDVTPAEAAATIDELLSALEGLERLVAAFSYTTRLSNTQRQRLEAARTAIARARGTAGE